MAVKRYLLDSDILIEHLRGRQQAKTFIARLKQEGELLVSAMTVAELFAGVRDQREEEAINTLLRQTSVITIDDRVAKRGGAFCAQYRHTHGTSLSDALIAASTEVSKATLVTFNRRHFPMITNLQVPYKR